MTSPFIHLLPVEVWATISALLATLLLYLSYYSLRTRLLKTVLEQTPFPWVIINVKSERIVAKTRGFSKLLRIQRGSPPSLSTLLSFFTTDEQTSLRAWFLGNDSQKIDVHTQKGSTFRLTKRELTSHLISVWFENITLRLEVEQSLEASQKHSKKLEAILNALPLPIWTCDPSSGRISFANSTYTDFLGESLETTLETQNHLFKRTKQRMGESGVKLHPLIIEGARRLYEMRSTISTTMALQVNYAHDATKEEDFSSELKRTIKSTYEMLDFLTTGLVIYGPDMRVKYYNQAYVKMFEPLGPLLETHPPLGEVLDELRRHRLLPEMTDFQDFKRRMVGQFTSLTAPLHDFRYLPNGQIFRLVTAPHPLGGLLYMFENITERISLENQYNTLIAVQKATIDNLFEGIAVFSSDNRLKLCNPAFCHIWGLHDDSSLLGRPLSKIMDDAKDLFFKGGDWAAFKERMIDNITNRSPKSGIIHRLDERVVAFAYAPLPDGANMVRYIDITDTTQVERALRERNDALEASDRLKSKFVANMSYELRSPLNTVIGFAEILLHSYFGILNDKQKEYTKGILDASKQLLTLINSILDLASIEAGHMVLQKSTLYIPEVLDRAIDLLRTDLFDQQHQLVVDYAQNLPSMEGDAWQLQQVFYNLLSNAIKFTPPQGHITLKAYEERQVLVIEVIDTGLGVDEKDQTRIFERFERTHSGTHTGVGLGLSLVKNFVELHHGTIHIASTPGQGTTITCRFPLGEHMLIAS
jgi:signal transduction histidine kinase